MERILHRPDVLYLIFVRQCYKLKFWLRPLHRNKLLKAITICVNSSEKKWYIKPYNKLILHREDGPAVINHKYQSWHILGLFHKDDSPAIIYTNGDHKWMKNSKYHREDGPAVINPDGTQLWFKNGENVNPF